MSNTTLISAEDLILPVNDLKGSVYGSMFRGCTSLTKAPKLPATNIADICYQFMFRGCTSLGEAPELPAMAVYTNSYHGMFEECSGLRIAPELPATSVGQSSYFGMFKDCISLEFAPELPATSTTNNFNNCYNMMFYGCTSLIKAPSILPIMTLGESCYNNMFYGCTSLTTTPELPATTLATSCYSHMFDNCTSLVNVPEILPATELANQCYNNMFRNCTSLTRAPELPALNVGYNCYNSMFYGCSNLSYIKALFTCETNVDGNTTNWVYRVAPTGTFVKNYEATWDTVGNNGVPTGWTIELTENPYASSPFTIEALETGVVTWALGNKEARYSKNGGSWKWMYSDTEIAVEAGDIIQIKGYYSDYNYNNISSTARFNVKGNLMSLIYEDNFQEATSISAYAFKDLFKNATNLVSAKDLIFPVIPLANSCYNSMFNGCTSLTTPPVLPETTLAQYCYSNMFQGCTSLTYAPELPNTVLANGCYYCMFRGCTSLVTAPELPATNLAESCYSEMFVECTSLTTAPVLPATTLVYGCYNSMFDGCTNLNYIKAMFTTTPGNSYTSYWVSGVSATGTFVKNVNATWNVTGRDGIPSGWTIQTASN